MRWVDGPVVGVDTETTGNAWRLAEGLPGAERGWPVRLPTPLLG